MDAADDTVTKGRDMPRRFSARFAIMLVLGLAGIGALVQPDGSSAAADELAAAYQDDGGTGALVYNESCSSCHQADGGGVAGSFPPLAGNPNSADAAYVESTVRDGLSGPIEVLGEAFDATMPPVTGLSDDDIAAVVAYVGSLADLDPDAAPEAPVAEVEPGDVDKGHDLFIGSTRLENGGAACSGCHTAGKVGNLGGSSLGPDLTDTVDTFGGEAGLAAWLTDPASATMMPIFDRHPMAENEIADVVAFLGDAPDQSKPSEPVDWLVLAAAAGFVILISGMAVAWRGMRQTYNERLRSKR